MSRCGNVRWYIHGQTLTSLIRPSLLPKLIFTASKLKKLMYFIQFFIVLKSHFNKELDTVGLQRQHLLQLSLCSVFNDIIATRQIFCISFQHISRCHQSKCLPTPAHMYVTLTEDEGHWWHDNVKRTRSRYLMGKLQLFTRDFNCGDTASCAGLTTSCDNKVIQCELRLMLLEHT